MKEQEIKGASGKTLTLWDLLSNNGGTVILSIRRDGILESAIEVNKGDLEWALKGE